MNTFKTTTTIAALSLCFGMVYADGSTDPAVEPAQPAIPPLVKAPAMREFPFSDEVEVPIQQPQSRALPSPLPSPPFPDSDWLGFPLIGAPYSGSSSHPLQRALGADKMLKNNIEIYGWANPSFNLSSSKNTNVPLSYDLVPNNLELDQIVLVVEKQPDTTQKDHQDVGFRMLGLYGTNYRYTIMKGVLSDQLINRNQLYGFDPVEMYAMFYFPKVADGMVLRVGRYISPPDIEAQLTPENYMYSHSLMFGCDPYTFMGINPMIRINKQWEIMAQIHGGNDMAVWSDSASPNIGLMARYASPDGKDGFWGGINSLGAGKVRNHHDDLQQIVGTWGHKFNEKVHMMTEAYYMWEFGADKGGTAIFGPPQYGTGGGPGVFLPGKSDATGLVNYFQIFISPKDFVSIRNDYLNDPRGFRYGFATSYTSHTIGYTRFLNPMTEFRPEIRYEHSYGAPAYDNGTKRDQWTIAADMIFRF